MTESTLAQPAPTLPKLKLGRIFGSGWFWLAMITAVFGFNVIRAMTTKLPEAPKVYYKVPTFALTDHLGQAFGSEQLQGRIWIANFVFTQCPTRCTDLTKKMTYLQKHLRHTGDTVKLVSFSVDPENDTPAVLKTYAEKADANPGRWRFLTGNAEAVKDAVVQGFKLPMEPDGDPDAEGKFLTITHGTRFVLVDQKHQIRGYYEADEESLRQLLSHVALLAGLEAAPGMTAEFERRRAEQR